MSPAWTVNARGVRVTVRLTPRGGRDAIDGVEIRAEGGLVLAVRVRAAPERGMANTALEHLLAKAVGVAPSAVAVASGAHSRLKMVTIDGDGPAIAAALDRCVVTGEPETWGPRSLTGRRSRPACAKRSGARLRR